jgi:hypothetical protein
MSPISPGDLVYVARWVSCKCTSSLLGHVYRVVSLEPRGCICRFCREIQPGPVATFSVEDERTALPLAWLRRIPPLSELGRRRVHRHVRVDGDEKAPA